MSNEQFLKLKSEPKTPALQSIRITAEMDAAIRSISQKTGIPLPELVRKMLDFAITHSEVKP